MRIKYYGLAFDYEPSTEVTFENSDVIKCLNQKINNFALINYYKFSKSYKSVDNNGFVMFDLKMFIELFMLDNNPRKYLFDNKDKKIYKVLDTPLEQSFNPAKRRIYQLPIELVNQNELRFDLDFLQGKFNELSGVLNATI